MKDHLSVYQFYSDEEKSKVIGFFLKELLKMGYW